jgi:hypothetical protein
MNPVALLLGGGWRYLAGAALLVGGYAWLTTTAYDRGIHHERGVWTTGAAVDAAASAGIAATLSALRQSRSVAADSNHARRVQSYAVQQAPITREVIHYVATPAAAVACPDLRGVQLGTAAIAAANAALAATR